MRVIRPLLLVLLGVAAGVAAVWLVRGPLAPPAEAPPAAQDGAAPDAPGPSAEAADEASEPEPAAATVPGLADSAEGEVRPLRSTELAFPVGGVLAERLVAVGEAVAAGDALLRLDDAQERARLREAEAAVAAAEAQVEVARTAEASAQEQVRAAQASLASAEAARDAADAALQLTATQAEATIAQARANLRQAEAGVAQAAAQVDQARAAVAQAAAQRAQAEAQRAQAEAARASAALAVERRTLRAPFDGRVLAIGPEVGEAVGAGAGAGATTLTLADLAGWRVDTTNLTELQVVGVDAGDRLTVEVDALPDRTFAGTVERVGFDPRQVRGDVTYVATVRIDAEAADAADLAELRPGMTAVVRGLLGGE
jgi:membrane fusion protein (multidrug efflux system)